MHHRTAISLITLAAVSTAASAQFDVFTDRSAWEAALAGNPIFTETFNDFSALTTVADGSTLDTGILQLSDDAFDAGGVTEVNPDGTAFGNLDGTPFLDNTTGGDPGEILTFTFNNNAVLGFGGDFFSPFSGSGIMLAIQMGDLTLPLDQLGTGFEQGFIGVVFTGGPLSEVQLVRDGSNGTFQELYSLDNVSYATPAPGSLALLGLGTLAAARRRR